MNKARTFFLILSLFSSAFPLARVLQAAVTTTSIIRILMQQ